MNRHHNFAYLGGVPNIPTCVGDRYYAQDLIRDFWYSLEASGMILKDITNTSKFIVRGGQLSAAGSSIVVQPCIGYAPYQVTIPSSATVPPSTTTADVRFIRIEIPTVYSVSFSSTSAVLDNITVNYVKVAYVEVDGTISRNRAKGMGSYYFEKASAFLFTISPTPPTAYELCLGSYVGNGSTLHAFGIVNKDPNYYFRMEDAQQNITVTPTAGTWTNQRSWGIAYKKNGDWRFKFFINGSVAAAVSTLTMSVTGIIFKASSFIEDVGLTSTWTTQTTVGTVQGACIPVQNTNQIQGRFANNQTNWLFQGDFALAGKPTWIP